MPRRWNKTEAFAHFGVSLTNTRWSWSGVSDDESTVALVLWQDGVKRHDGRYEYHDQEDLDAAWRKRAGHAERLRHLIHARDNLDGRFRAVIAKAADVDADPRDIASCHPQKGVWWRLSELDEETGAFSAHVLTRDE